MDQQAYEELVATALPERYRRYWPVVPTLAQMTALSLDHVPDLMYGGAKAGGKSIFMLLAASYYAWHPKHRALLLRKTYKDLTRPGALLDVAKNWWVKMPGVEYKAQDMKFIFESGATIEFGHLGNANAHKDHQGSENTFIGIDEASLIPHNQIDDMRLALRKSIHIDLPLQFRLTCNPGDISHEYLKRRYVDARNTSMRMFIPAKSNDNPHLDSEEYARQFDGKTEVERRQLLHGDWSVMPSTDFFKLDRLNELDEIPDKDWYWCRSWDFAATEPAPGKDPDYTVGVKIGEYDGEFIIADLERFREEPGRTTELLLECAHEDGHTIDIVGEEEGGSAGKTVTNVYSRMLPGFAYTGIRPTGSKKDRAKVLATAIQNGNVTIVSGDWTHDFINELRSFPQGNHDDQVDAVTQGIQYLVDESPVW